MKKDDHDRGQHNLSDQIRNAAPDLIRENTHPPTGPEGMTEKEKASYVLHKYGNGMPKKRNTKP